MAAAAWGKDDPYMDALPSETLRVLLAAEPGLLRQMPGGERDLMPYLCCHFGRWALLQQWAAAAAAPRAVPAALDAALAARPARFWRLAQYADVDGASGAAVASERLTNASAGLLGACVAASSATNRAP